MSDFTNIPVGARIFVVWDPYISRPYSTKWDDTITVWDGGATVWDGGATHWGDPLTTWVE